MASYQEIETRLGQVERLLEFISKAIQIAQPSPLAGMPPRVTSMFDLFHAANQAGLTIESSPVPEEPAPAEVSEANHG